LQRKVFDISLEYTSQARKGVKALYLSLSGYRLLCLDQEEKAV
jgi:hypothetical protein